MTNEHTFKSFKIGAINDLFASQNVTVSEIIMRTGHDCTALNAIFEYILNHYLMQAKCGRDRGGWRNPSKHLKAPRLRSDVLDEVILASMNVGYNNETKLHNFIVALLQIQMAEFKPRGRLWNGSVMLAATLILW